MKGKIVNKAAQGKGPEIIRDKQTVKATQDKAVQGKGTEKIQGKRTDKAAQDEGAETA